VCIGCMVFFFPSCCFPVIPLFVQVPVFQDGGGAALVLLLPLGHHDGGLLLL